MMLELVEIANYNERTLPIVKHTPISKLVSRVHRSTMTYNNFFSEFLIGNKPCIIDSQITENWPCRQQWILNGAPNFEILNSLFGQCIVPVADCKKRYYNSQLKDDMTMERYLEYWIQYKTNNYASDMPLLYLKDWHCIKSFPDISIYEVPHYFASDWLNEYYVAKPELNDDYMFVYMGPKGTWTPLHADVFVSYSWSANIVGKKRWLLLPPTEENRFRDLHGQLAYDATSEELNDRLKYRMYDCHNLKCIDVVQEAGEIIFVPSGWYHQVWNLEDTISVNHNWINGCNIYNIWLGLKQELLSVMKEVEDCRDMSNWAEHCQLMLKTSYGMDYIQFYNFISFIAKKRLDLFDCKNQVISFKKFQFGINHCLFDLKTLSIVLTEFIANAKEKCINELISKDDEPHVLLDKINITLRTVNGRKYQKPSTS